MILIVLAVFSLGCSPCNVQGTPNTSFVDLQCRKGNILDQPTGECTTLRFSSALSKLQAIVQAKTLDDVVRLLQKPNSNWPVPLVHPVFKPEELPTKSVELETREDSLQVDEQSLPGEVPQLPKSPTNDSYKVLKHNLSLLVTTTMQR